MHYNASMMRRHHQTVAVYDTYDYVLSCITMQHGAVMHYNASTMRRHHQTVAVYDTYDYVVKHERNTVLLCGNRSTTYYVLFSHSAACC